jgi:hypothetical protein
MRVSFFGKAWVLALALSPGFSFANPSQTPAVPDARFLVADPAQRVAPIAYQSRFDRPLQDAGLGERDWRQANNEVGVFKRGHVDILKREDAEQERSLRTAPRPADSASGPRPVHKH